MEVQYIDTSATDDGLSDNDSMASTIAYFSVSYTVCTPLIVSCDYVKDINGALSSQSLKNLSVPSPTTTKNL